MQVRRAAKAARLCAALRQRVAGLLWVGFGSADGLRPWGAAGFALCV
ncbi:MAG: hypothetical protein RR367_09935 [Clostridia bacterium]